MEILGTAILYGAGALAVTLIVAGIVIVAAVVSLFVRDVMRL